MAPQASSEPDTGEILPQHRLDQRALEDYLSRHLPGFEAEPTGPLTVSQYRSGQSNPTFYLRKGCRAYVLRKKPPGSLLPKAHKIDREFHVQKALFSNGFPVPKPLLYCNDVSVIGTEFYVMEHVKGRIFRDFSLPGVCPAERSALYVAMIETLARLHSLNIQSLGLEVYGKGEGYCKRQVLTWTKQYEAAAHQNIPAMNQLSAWLMENLPDQDQEQSLVHGDFKMDNLIFHPKEGVYARYLLGNSASETSFMFADVVKPLAEIGLQFAKRTLSATVSQPDPTGKLFLQTRTGQEVLLRVKRFMQQYILPAEKEVIEFYISNENSPDKWKRPVVIEKLKETAKAEGLWNLFLPALSGLSQVDYALIAEETGKCFLAPEIFNCQAPDTGNMEVLHLYGSAEQKKQWLEPLLQGEIKSCFCMTEPDVASSDATNIECSIDRDGENYVINGKKWWSSGAGNSQCKVAIVLGRSKNSSAPRHKQHSMILVPINTPGVELVRPLPVFGYLDNFHGGHFEIHFNNVRVPASNLILGEGRGFEIAQGRLGPGRIHHCMRSIGVAEKALKIMCERASQRVTFQKKLYAHEVVAHWIAESRIAIEEVRLLTLKAAHSIDTVGSAQARKEIAMIKVAAPRAVCTIVDRAIQVCGAAGVSQDFPLAEMYAMIRTLRIADGPDEVHLSAVAKMELQDQALNLTARM
ncbi:acyl-CoA dehydrogenase family member 11 isoform X2 [Notamacropus eugenii]|uniref:acyl-CoA dehydrogenase family member 11 isoform X2 n=1 Tax=Notamacropus eugenii TaxID=9315 RepID=UPI003B679036